MTKQTHPEETQIRGHVSLAELFLTFFKINLFTFGGGYTIVPVIRDEFVMGKKAIEEEEMLNLVALAQSGPGPMAINTSILTGYRVRGPIGAIVSLVAAVLPCLIVISLLFYVYREFRANEWVNAAFSVMAGTISAILLVTTWNMGKVALKKHPFFGLGMMIGAFVAGYVLNLNAAIIILICGMMGLVLFSLVEESKVK